MEVIIDDSAFRRFNENLFRNLKDAEKVLGRAMFNARALIQNRIQQQGLNSDEAQIGQYSSKKTKKGESGYKAFRQKLGRQTQFIDLTLTGDLFRGWQVDRVTNGYELGFTSGEAAKASGIEKRYGTIFQLSKLELELVESIINEDINAIINES